jgi:ATP-binding cassette subfamily B protein
LAVARKLPGLIGQAIRLGWQANRCDTAATIGLNLVSGVLTGFALLAKTGVLEALFAAGPTPHRVRAALPSLIVVAAAVAAWAGLQARGGLGPGQAQTAGRPVGGDQAAQPDHASRAGRLRRRGVLRRHATGA